MQFDIVTDSSCNLLDEMINEFGLHILPLTFMSEGEQYQSYTEGEKSDLQRFYKMMREGKIFTTSLPNRQDAETKFRSILSAGRDVLYIGFSSGLSGTYGAMAAILESLRAEFPDRVIEIVDSLCASGGQGLLVYLCAKEKQAGKNLQEVKIFAEKNKENICHWFTVNDLNHLKRGGRVNAATALFGTMLAIKPVLHVDDDGHLVSMEKARGRRASLIALVDHMEATAIHPEKYPAFITHGDCIQDAEFVAEEVRRRLSVRETYISYVGPVIGSHTGQGVVTLFFFGQPR